MTSLSRATALLLTAIAACAGTAEMLLGRGGTHAVERPDRIFLPTAREDIVKNPGVGYQTFLQSAAADAQFPSSTMYVRVNWSAVEPAAGELDFHVIDRALMQAQLAGQRLAFRVMAFEEHNSGPIAFRNAGYPGFAFTFDRTTKVWVPDLDDDKVQQSVKKLIEALGRRYGNNPGIDSVDVGLIGDWGEQHFWNTDPQPPYPKTETLKWLFDQFKSNFNVPVVVNDGIWDNDREAFRYAVRNGLGWRADCWGGPREMHFKYPRIIAEVPDAWMSGPILMETCGVMADWAARGEEWQRNLQWAIDHHVSQINNKSSAVPLDMLAGVRRMLSGLGYRMVLKRATFPAVVASGAGFSIELDWENVGNAPMYFNRRVLLKLGSRVVETDFSMRGFAPGARSDRFIISTSGLAVGRHKIQVGLGPSAAQPPDIALAIKGAGAWYPVGILTVVN